MKDETEKSGQSSSFATTIPGGAALPRRPDQPPAPLMPVAPLPGLTPFQSRLSQGLCGRCGKVPPLPGRTKCAECSPGTWQQHRAAGWCGRCGQRPPLAGHALCETCQSVILPRARQAVAKQRRIAAIFSFCREWHDPPVPAEKPGGWYCAAHNAAHREKSREIMRKLRAERRAQGLCPECGVSSPDGTCEKCRARKR